MKIIIKLILIVCIVINTFLVLACSSSNSDETSNSNDATIVLTISGTVDTNSFLNHENIITRTDLLTRDEIITRNDITQPVGSPIPDFYFKTETVLKNSDSTDPGLIVFTTREDPNELDSLASLDIDSLAVANTDGSFSLPVYENANEDFYVVLSAVSSSSSCIFSSAEDSSYKASLSAPVLCFDDDFLFILETSDGNSNYTISSDSSTSSIDIGTVTISGSSATAATDLDADDSISSSSSSSVSNEDTLGVYYKFDNNLSDSSGYENNATGPNGDTGFSYINEDPEDDSAGRAISLDGFDDYLIIEDKDENGISDFTSGNELTIFALLNIDESIISAKDSTSYYIFSSGYIDFYFQITESGSIQIWAQIEIQQDTTNIGYTIKANDYWNPAVIESLESNISLAFTLQSGVINTIINGQPDENGECQVYSDSQELIGGCNSTYTGNIRTSAPENNERDAYIGRKDYVAPAESFSYFKGIIFEFRIYNEALNSTEILDLHNSLY
ncbi:MAG: hypothetical protein ABIA04_03095 [Pseudomonadota bacterium]